MGYNGNNIQADVEAVWKASVTIFPRMADAYQAANAAVHSTHYSTDEHSKFFPKWQNLRDDFQMILYNEAWSLWGTADALCDCVKEYTETDVEAATALHKAREALPAEVGPEPEAYIPWSYQGPAMRYEDTKVESASSEYSGSAPSVADLVSKAQTVDDKLYEASKVEASLIESGILAITPRSWVDDAASEAGWEFVMDRMTKTAKLEPGAHQFAITSLDSIGADTPASGNFLQLKTDNSNARDALNPDKWDSGAARTFRSEHLNAYDDIVANQGLILAVLADSVEGYQESLENTYRTYAEAMDSAIASLDSIIAGGEGKYDSLMTTVLTATLAVAGAAGTAGLSLAVAGSSISVAGAAFSIGGSLSGDIHRSVLEGISTIKETLTEFDTELSSKLTTIRDVVYDKMYDTSARIQRPVISPFATGDASL